MFVRTESFKEFIRYYPVITAIVLIHLILYILTFLPILPTNWIFESFSGVNLYIMQGEWWRLVTAMFLHASFAHLLFNSFTLIIFGPPLEQMLGKIRFLLLYLSTGIIANIATFILKPLTYASVGSSGAIFGLFGIYIALILFYKELMSYNNKQIVVTILVIGLIMTFLQPQINATAHIVGLLSGFILGTFMLGKRKELTKSAKRTFNRLNIERFSAKYWFWIIIVILVIIGIFSH